MTFTLHIQVIPNASLENRKGEGEIGRKINERNRSRSVLVPLIFKSFNWLNDLLMLQYIKLQYLRTSKSSTLFTVEYISF
jgi:hypothetical protein